MQGGSKPAITAAVERLALSATKSPGATVLSDTTTTDPTTRRPDQHIAVSGTNPGGTTGLGWTRVTDDGRGTDVLALGTARQADSAACAVPDKIAALRFSGVPHPAAMP